MTSMPASRSARAITLAPRSWPSRPGLAMTTRIFCILDEGDFFVLSPDLAQRVAHLANGGVGADAVEERGHRVALPARRLFQRVERAAYFLVVARLLERLQAG